MSDQPRLPFHGEPPHVAGSGTSEDAAQQMRATAATLRAKVLRVLADRGPSTCDEVEVALGMRHQTASARIRELFLMGRIIDSNMKRRTRSNRKAIVWSLAS